MRIVALHEQLSDDATADAKDALVQLALVERELQDRGHSCHRLAIDLDFERARRSLGEIGPDLVFNLVESLGGSGRLAHLAPALVEALGIPCTGAPSRALLETTDKLHAKRRFRAAGLPTPDWFERDAKSCMASAADQSLTFIVKPVYEDASIGVTDDAVVFGRNAANARLAELRNPGFAEAYIEGREFNLAMLEKPGGVEILPVAEITFEAWPDRKPRIVGYAAKWEDDSFESRHTPRRFEIAPSDAVLVARLQALAHRCWQLFELRGFARVDFRVDAAGEPWVLEINANPCLSPDAGFAAAATRAGFSTREVVERIVAAAFASEPNGSLPWIDQPKRP